MSVSPRTYKLIRAVRWGIEVLGVVIITYTIALPLLPEVQFQYARLTGFHTETSREQVGEEISPDNDQPIDEDFIVFGFDLGEEKTSSDGFTNNLSIPKIGMDISLDAEGSSESGLVWRRVHTATPGEGSNTVIVGHRFSTLAGRNPEVFYHLPKLELEDEIVVTWEGARYYYRIVEEKIVTPDAVEIEDSTTKERLTLYTCTPLWSTAKRHVIIADLIKVDYEA